MKTARQWADHLVDNVSCVTQLDPERDELPNVEEWRLNAEKLFALATKMSEEETALRAAAIDLIRVCDKIPDWVPCNAGVRAATQRLTEALHAVAKEEVS